MHINTEPAMPTQVPDVEVTAVRCRPASSGTVVANMTLVPGWAVQSVFDVSGRTGATASACVHGLVVRPWLKWAHCARMADVSMLGV